MQLRKEALPISARAYWYMHVRMCGIRRGFCTLMLFNLLTADLPQCFSNRNCTGAVVDAADQRDCCVGTDDGLSYHNGTNCHLCIGMLLC